MMKFGMDLTDTEDSYINFLSVVASIMYVIVFI